MICCKSVIAGTCGFPGHTLLLMARLTFSKPSEVVCPPFVLSIPDLHTAFICFMHPTCFFQKPSIIHLDSGTKCPSRGFVRYGQCGQRWAVGGGAKGWDESFVAEGRWLVVFLLWWWVRTTQFCDGWFVVMFCLLWWSLSLLSTWALDKQQLSTSSTMLSLGLRMAQDDQCLIRNLESKAYRLRSFRCFPMSLRWRSV